MDEEPKSLTETEKDMKETIESSSSNINTTDERVDANKSVELLEVSQKVEGAEVNHSEVDNNKEVGEISRDETLEKNEAIEITGQDDKTEEKDVKTEEDDKKKKKKRKRKDGYRRGGKKVREKKKVTEEVWNKQEEERVKTVMDSAPTRGRGHVRARPFDERHVARKPFRGRNRNTGTWGEGGKEVEKEKQGLTSHPKNHGGRSQRSDTYQEKNQREKYRKDGHTGTKWYKSYTI